MDEMWKEFSWLAGTSDKQPLNPSTLDESADNELREYVHKAWMRCEHKGMSLINHPTATTDSL
jgi:hypothetical protein